MAHFHVMRKHIYVALKPCAYYAPPFRLLWAKALHKKGWFLQSTILLKIQHSTKLVCSFKLLEEKKIRTWFLNYSKKGSGENLKVFQGALLLWASCKSSSPQHFPFFTTGTSTLHYHQTLMQVFHCVLSTFHTVQFLAIFKPERNSHFLSFSWNLLDLTQPNPKNLAHKF